MWWPPTLTPIRTCRWSPTLPLDLPQRFVFIVGGNLFFLILAFRTPALPGRGRKAATKFQSSQFSYAGKYLICDH
jgi:hypothetical protein